MFTGLIGRFLVILFCEIGTVSVVGLVTSVAVPDPGSGAFLTPGPGSGIRNRFFPDPGSRIPDPKPIFFIA